MALLEAYGKGKEIVSEEIVLKVVKDAQLEPSKFN